jgi:hypothetical protein
LAEDPVPLFDIEADAALAELAGLETVVNHAHDRAPVRQRRCGPGFLTALIPPRRDNPPRSDRCDSTHAILHVKHEPLSGHSRKLIQNKHYHCQKNLQGITGA